MTQHHSRCRLIGLVAMATILLVSSQAVAQRRPQEPHLAYAYPAGCQLGTSCTLVLGGQNLKEVSEAFVWGEGVQVEILDWYRPLTRGMYMQLRNSLRDARERLIDSGAKSPSAAEVATEAGLTERQLREMEIYRQRDQDSKRQPNEQLEEELTVRLTVAADAKPGKYELRLVTETAMSNPFWLHVGTWAERRETEPNDTTAQEISGQLPIVINGQIMPGDRDSFSFTANEGQCLVISAAAREVIPFLADAVPGWFQATMKLTDETGKQVAFADSFHFRQDPVIYFEVPRDGRYTVEIRDTLFRGREDFVYRITIGEIPFVTSIFPLGAARNSRATIELTGWNLSQTQLDIKTTSARQFRPVRWYSVPQSDGAAVRFPLRIDRLQEVMDEEPNEDVAEAQRVNLRTVINGRIDRPGDHDVFFISGGGRLAAEVRARRHGSPLDSMLTLTDRRGREIAFNDDYEDKSEGLATHHADSRLIARIPSTGAYLHLSDAQGNGGKQFVYRLYLRAPEQDFELRVTPSSIIARPGAVVPINVYALRQDDFKEDIQLALIDPPAEFRLAGGILPGNAEHVQVTLTMPDKAPEGPVVLEMAGRAKRKGGRTFITKPAIPAENMMQAFIWYHLVPVEDWQVVVSGSRSRRPAFDIVYNRTRIPLRRGGDVFIPVRPHNQNLVVDEIKLELDEPKGISAQLLSDRMGRYALKLTTDADEVEAGLRGNLLFQVFRETTPAPTKANPQPQPRRTAYGYLPAVPFEVNGSQRGNSR